MTDLTDATPPDTPESGVTWHGLSSVQQVIWFDQMLHPQLPHYQIGMSAAIDGPLDVALLQRAIEAVAQGSEALRMVLQLRDGQPGLQVLPHTCVALPVVDVSDQADALAQAQALVQAEFCRPLNLQDSPPWRMMLVRHAPDRYLWLQCYHHLVIDGFGINVANRVICETYQRWLEGDTRPAAPTPSYLDFLDAEQAYAQSPRPERDRAYWRERFASLPPALLPARYVAQPPSAPASGKQVWRINRERYARINAFATRHEMGPAHFFLALLHACLSRTAGADEIVIGVPVHNRGTAAHKQTIGMFSSMNPIGVPADSERSFVALMQAFGAELRRCFRHQRLPISEINREIGLIRSGRPQLYDVSFSLEAFAADMRLGEASHSFITLSNQAEQTPLAMAVKDCYHDRDVEVELVYNLAHLSHAEAVLLSERLDVACNAILDGFEGPLWQMPIMSAREAHQVVHGFNQTDAPFDANATLHGLFEQQAAQHPQRTALVFDGQSLSYADLNARADQLAAQLQAQGLQANALVALALERGVAMVVALLATLKCGAAYVPLDLGMPADRLADMLREAQPALLLTQSAQQAALPIPPCPLVLLDHEGLCAGIDCLDPLNLLTSKPQVAPPGLTSRSLAYVIYTSGSTGRPKGVMNEHRGVVNRLLWMQKAYSLGAHDSVLQKTPYSFDVSVWEFFWPLIVGARLVLAKPGGHQDPAYLRELIHQERITTVHFVPSMLQVFIDELGSDAVANAHGCTPARGTAKLDHLRRIICSGEALPWPLARHTLAVLPHAELHNLYGPTEAAIDVTAWDCRAAPASTELAPRVPIGRPIDNIRLYILDAHDQPVPVGVPGELHIGGVGVARGYLHQAELSASRFVPDPFCADPQARLYKSGDVACWRADGAIDYLGRVDHQVKLRGQRIELGDIEAQLASHPAVKEAVVLVHTLQGDQRLVAYVTLHTLADALAQQHAPGSTDEAQPHDLTAAAQATLRQALRAHLRQQLPEYMVPNAIVLMPALPLSRNGKLDRQALPLPEEADGLGAAADKAPPQGPVEAALAGVWQAVLGLKQVGRDDHFFDLGGHSLLVLKASQALRPLGWQLDVRTAFAHPVLRDLAQALAAQGPATQQVLAAALIPPGCAHITPSMLPLVSLTPQHIARITAQMPGGAANVQDIYPLSPLQEGMLFHHVLGQQAEQPTGDAYIMPMLLEVDTRARLDGLLAALQQVMDRHDALRTAILWADLPQPVQVVLRQATLPVATLALPGSTPDGLTPLATLQQRMAPQRLHMVLSEAPLLRVEIAQNPGHSSWYAILYVHHLVDDNHSLQIVRAEIAACIEGHAASLPAPVPYRHFVAHTLRRGQQDEARAYWQSLLADVDEPTAPFGVLDVHSDGSDTSEASEALPAALAAGIIAQTRRLGVTPAALFHAAWALLVAQTSGRDDVLFGTVLSGRLYAADGAAQAVGAFINTLPMRLQLGGLTAQQAVRRAHEAVMGLMAHEHAPLALAQEASGVAAGVPLFTSVLNYRHRQSVAQVDETQPWPGVTVLAAQERSNYPLVVSVDDCRDAFVLRLQAVKQIGAARCVKMFVQAISALTQALGQATTPHVDTPVLALSTLPEPDRAQVLSGFNQTTLHFADTVLTAGLYSAPHAGLAHGLVAQQALRAGHATAMIMGDAQMSYAELNARANQCARLLRASGVQSGDLVALFMPRGLELIVGLLGILKAGAAYVPVDTAYPARRIAHLLSDSAARLVLTHSALVGLLPQPACQVLALDEQAERLAALPDANLSPQDAPVSPDDLAYVIYTSGSTGEPKGVMVTHANVWNLACTQRHLHQVSSDSRVLQFGSISFDASIWAPRCKTHCAAWPSPTPCCPRWPPAC
jgi:amino acid adenylation domain-containing protein